MKPNLRTPRTIRIRLFGEFEIEEIPDSPILSRKARTLVKALALLPGKPVESARLIDTCWPESFPANPEDQLAVLVSRIRRMLGTHRVRRVGVGYALYADWVDVAAVRELEGQAQSWLEQGRYPAAYEAARSGLNLIRGPMLSDEGEAEWTAAARREAERLRGNLTRTAAEAALAVGEYTSASAMARSALEDDAYDERALLCLMTALVASGRDASALAAFDEFRVRLSEDLGIDPNPTLQAAHMAILRGDPIIEQI